MNFFHILSAGKLSQMTFGTFQTRIPICGIRKCCTCINVNDPYIISAVRTPIGSFQGKLSSQTAVQLGAKALSAAVEKSKVPKDDIQELIVGCAIPSGLGQAPDKQIGLFAGLPHNLVTSTVGKLCGSGMKAVMNACQGIVANCGEVVAAGGIESVSNIPYLLRRKPMRMGNICLPDALMHDGLYDFIEQVDVTHFAEMIAKDYKISREQQDEYGMLSYTRAQSATDTGAFAAELTPITLKKKSEEDEVICVDEELGRLDVTKYYDLKPETGECGTITPGNSSAMCDGASMLIIASGNYVLKKGLQPLARVVSYADACLEPKLFCIAPAVAIPKALVKANLTADRIDLWEIMETFALTAIVNMKILKLDHNRVNIHGSGVSLGHAFGMSGARLVTHLAHVLGRGELGCAAISHAGGGASCMIIEKL